MRNIISQSPKGNILVVDDTPANLRLLSQMLTESDYYVRPVPDGSLALSAVQAEPPDLILLDIRMPGMDGYEVCKFLKEGNQTRDIPIIFISALDAIQDKIKAFNVGGADYITKPFQVEEVLARIETHLALRRLQKQLQEANKKMAQELTLAGEVQRSFLPRNYPDIPGWQLTAAFEPARETSGDFYDFIPLPNNNIGIVMADVCDKGAGAALYMALSWALIRTYAAEYPLQPAKVLNAVNRRIINDTKTDNFITIFFGVVNLDTGRLWYCNAGHCVPYLISEDHDVNVRYLARTGMAVGVLEEDNYEQEAVEFASGDLLLLYTDGISEAQNAQGAFLDMNLLLKSVKTNLKQPIKKIQEAILTEVKGFVGNTPQADDLALVLLLRDTECLSSIAE